MAGSGSETAPDLSVQRVMDAVQDGDDKNGNVDDNTLVLSRDQLRELERFRNRLRGETNDDGKMKLCEEKCNELLRDVTAQQILIATFDDVMLAACRGYKTKKQEKASARTPLPTGRNKKNDNIAERDVWERYLGIAIDAAQVKSKILVALKAVADRWGREIVVHHQWASRGEYFCNLLRAGAKAFPVRDNAARALTIIMIERHLDIKRHCQIACSRDPITLSDLERLKKFSMSAIKDIILPPGFGLDEFGIIVHEQFAARLPLSTCSTNPPTSDLPTGPSNVASNSELSNPPETNTESSEPPTNPQHSEAAEGGLMNDTTTNRNINNAMTGSAESAADTREPPGPAGTQGADIAARMLLVLQGGSGHPSLGNSSNLSSALSSPPDSPFTAGSSATDISTPEAGDHGTAEDSFGRALRPRTNLPSYHGQVSNSAKPAQRPHRQPHTPALHKKQCCPSSIPPKLLAILDDNTSSGGHLLRAYVDFGTKLPYETMCRLHLQKFAEKILETEVVKTSLKQDDRPMPDLLNRRRRASLSDINPTPPKKSRLSGAAVSTPDSAATEGISRQIRGEVYQRQVLRELEQAKLKGNSYGARTNSIIRNILSKATYEAYFCTEDEASMKVNLGLISSPIFTQGQQRSQQGDRRPIAQLLCSMGDLGFDRTVSVQIPSSIGNASFKKKSLREVRDRFLKKQPLDDPWNLLDLQSPFPSKLPRFLEGDNCQLLLRIRDAALMGQSGERHMASIEDWSMWRNVTEWGLLSEGGHNTAPHVDSHGYSTWIQVQEGEIGFGWMSNPTPEEQEAWAAAPGSYTGGKWRFTILSPGDTAFFQSDTIHFVFRTRQTQTFAVGGHILLWSGIQQWMENVIAQLRNPDITNEQMDDMPKIVCIAKKLVKNRVGIGRIGEMGGPDAVTRFLALAEDVINLSRRVTADGEVEGLAEMHPGLQRGRARRSA